MKDWTDSESITSRSNQYFPYERLVIVIVVFVLVMSLPIVSMMFTADVVTVDPMMMMLRPMALNPDHFVIVGPVTRSVRVIRAVADFDPEFLSGKVT